MARIALAWELGGERGHALGCVTLGRALLLRGHRVALMFSNLEALRDLPDAGDFEAFEAPHGMAGKRLATPATYAEIALGTGYDQVESLLAIAAGWRRLLADWKPDVVVTDFAPTAHLAARHLGIRRISFGSGFLVPPRVAPMPSFRFDEPVPSGHAERMDEQATATVNEVLRRWGDPPIASFARLLDCDDEFLCTFPELDHYPARPRSGYWGPRFNLSAGVRASWPARARKRIFLYAKREHSATDAVIEALARSPFALIAFVSGLDEARRARLAGGQRQAFAEPVRLEPLLPECDLVISHGGEIGPGTLLHGIPQLVFPLQYENYLTARRIEQAGAGRWLPMKASARDVAQAIAALLDEARYGQAARALARRYVAFSPKEQRRRMAVRIEEVAALGPAGAKLAEPPNGGMP